MSIGRLRVLCYFLFKNRNNVTLGEVIDLLLKPSTIKKGLQFIREMKPFGDYLEVSFQGCGRKLLWPQRMPMRNLYGTVYEVFSNDKSNWHYYEIKETAVRPSDIVADCGSAEGLFALAITDRCKEVYAIEPNPYFAEALSKQFVNNNNVIVIPKALGSTPGKAYIVDMSTGSNITDDTSGIEIDITTIDELFFRQGKRLDYLKADLEGYELPMLQGARESINAYHPRIAITTYHKQNKFDEIRDEVLSIVPGYRWKIKGIERHAGKPVMLHMWCDE